GPEIAPERFVWAALDQVERTPQRDSWRVALENTPMLFKVAVPVLGAAAVIALALFIYGRINPAPTGTPVHSPAAVASPTACARDLVERPAPGTLDVVWCVERDSEWIVVPFTLQAPAAWGDSVDAGGRVLYVSPPGQPAVLVALLAPDTADGWITKMESNPSFNVTDRGTLETAGGSAATAIDVMGASANYGGQDPGPIFSNSERPWYLIPGHTARVWVLDGPGGEAVAIGTMTDDADLPAWADSVAEIVQTLEWGTP
ncbi:MAG TPA: hypothetical protein VFY43_03090, partial [Candidatus Limnocylindria bacterium]|nr:hypothetical protein [Candidatus Limnocylindria bacterium]